MALVVRSGGRTVFTKGFRKATADTPFFIASGSKWLIAATLMTLVDDGLVTLDTPISRYLPTFTGKKKGLITLRHLLNHTSGLPAKSRGPRELKKAVDQIGRQLRLATTPGSQFCYGNLSFKVAARLAEVVTQKPWQQIFEERIAAPLGMTQTYFPKRGLGADINKARSSAVDYATFLEMFRNEGLGPGGGRVLSREAVREMKRNQTEGLEMRGINRAQHEKMARMEYGLGLWREQVNPVTHEPAMVSHYGTPGFRGVINYQNDYIIVLAVRTRRTGTKKFLRKRFLKTLAVADRFFSHSQTVTAP